MTNRFKGLDLIDTVLEELWTKICKILQEAVNKNIPKKSKCNKAKCLSEEALQIAEKRREVKGKEEREKYTQLNAEFQRITRRDKKAFLSKQCKECSNYLTIALISHASKVMLKILQARLQQYVKP